MGGDLAKVFAHQFMALIVFCVVEQNVVVAELRRGGSGCACCCRRC